MRFLLVLLLLTVNVEAVPAAFPKADGYRGIWYYNQPTKDEYVYKYSGGLGTYCANHIPMAVYAPDDNKTFFVYGGTTPNNDTLFEMVGYYDHATGKVPRPTIVMDKKTTEINYEVWKKTRIGFVFEGDEKVLGRPFFPCYNHKEVVRPVIWDIEV